MLAVMGAWFQAIYTGTGPIDNLFAHLADPGHATIFAVSIKLSIFLNAYTFQFLDLTSSLKGPYPHIGR